MSKSQQAAFLLVITNPSKIIVVEYDEILKLIDDPMSIGKSSHITTRENLFFG